MVYLTFTFFTGIPYFKFTLFKKHGSGGASPILAPLPEISCRLSAILQLLRRQATKGLWKARKSAGIRKFRTAKKRPDARPRRGPSQLNVIVPDSNQNHRGSALDGTFCSSCCDCRKAELPPLLGEVRGRRFLLVAGDERVPSDRHLRWLSGPLTGHPPAFWAPTSSAPPSPGPRRARG